MRRDGERIGRIQESLERDRLDALVAAAPNNVLLLSGYWPVTGTSFAVATKEGRIGLAIPEDERDLAGARLGGRGQDIPTGVSGENRRV